MAPIKTIAAILFLFIIVLIAAFAIQSQNWSFTINGDSSKSVDNALYAKLANDTVTYDGVTGIPIEIFLAYYGVYPITAVSYGGNTYDWETVASGADKDIAMLVEANGSLYYSVNTSGVKNINVTTVDKPAVSTLDIEPSVLYALDSGGKDDLIHEKTTHVVLFYVDAMGYYRFMDAKQKGLVDNMSSLGEPIKAICVYPSVTQPNAKAMTTGISPNLVRGDFRSYLPYNDTMLDILERKGLTAVWVDGDSAPVKVNNTVYNLDRNGDGSKDDEAADTGIKEYQSGASLVVVHFKDTDTKMHTYGPNSTEAEGALKNADALIGNVVKNLDNGTIVIIYADHGCHTLANGGGNHGTLLPDDMYIPFIIARV